LPGVRERVIASACLLLLAGNASADDLPPLADPAPVVDNPNELDLSYLWDGGAIPFLWAPLAARLALDAHAAPREEPLAFPNEGGAEKSDWQIPGWAISSLGGVSAIGMIASGDRSRLYHVKGLAQSLSTGCLLTGIAKVTFGRRRPYWTEDSGVDARRSFPSGHSTQAFAIATYTALYLRGHVFDELRGDSTLPWWEAVTYAGIATGATLLAAERVWHNRHHKTDVIVGGLVGTATSALFYIYQDGRYDDREAERRKQLSIVPVENGDGAAVTLSFGW
jgi:membrane-associated phospholipid phosphatase